MSHKILLVDDEEDIVLTVKLFLEANNCAVTTAADGAAAYAKATAEPWDLIILDLMLPKMDGYKVCRMLKFDDKFRKVPVILFSARAQAADIKLGAEVGADAYIVKPFEPQELLKELKRLLPQFGQ